MITYAFLQHYWWFLISLLGGLLAFLLFVQGGQSMLFSLPGNDGQKKVMLSVLGRKWEYTFTTLVTFGGALFASFPLFYSTSFGGAYWLWMLILLSFVLQAVSYEFRSRPGNVFGTKTYDIFLFINGLLGTLLVGVVIGTFFTGSDFTVARDNITTVGAPVISRWGNAWHGLESIANLRNLCLGAAVLFLARTLALLLFINRAGDEELRARCRRGLWYNALPFVVFFLVFVIWTFLGSGYAVNSATGEVFMQEHKYFLNMVEMPAVGIAFVLGVAGVLYGIARLRRCPSRDMGCGHRDGRDRHLSAAVRGLQRDGLLSLFCRPAEFADHLQCLVEFLYPEGDVGGVAAHPLRARLHRVRMAFARKEACDAGGCRERRASVMPCGGIAVMYMKGGRPTGAPLSCPFRCCAARDWEGG